jgi:hypothetical protein
MTLDHACVLEGHDALVGQKALHIGTDWTTSFLSLGFFQP